ncbi:hypothetical protein BJ912DRAFT_933365 [Pholiota molesta]|nr:hypothetical protein BJ912DRAFT_933365 [Pholiota molesta]
MSIPAPMAGSDSSDEVPLWDLLSDDERTIELRRFEGILNTFNREYVDLVDKETIDSVQALRIIRHIAVDIARLGFDVWSVARSKEAFGVVHHLWESEKAILDLHNGREGSTEEHCLETRRMREMCQYAVQRDDCVFSVWLPDTGTIFLEIVRREQYMPSVSKIVRMEQYHQNCVQGTIFEECVKYRAHGTISSSIVHREQYSTGVSNIVRMERYRRAPCTGNNIRRVCQRSCARNDIVERRAQGAILDDHCTQNSVRTEQLVNLKFFPPRNLDQERERSRIRMRELRRKRKEEANASQPLDHDDPLLLNQSEDEDNELVSLKKKIDSVHITQPHFPLTQSLLSDPPTNHVVSTPIPSIPQKWGTLPQEAQADWAAKFLATHPRHHTFIKEMLAHQEKGLEMVLRFSEDLISANYEEMQEANGIQPEVES